jgi:stage III sporulation protein AE
MKKIIIVVLVCFFTTQVVFAIDDNNENVIDRDEIIQEQIENLNLEKLQEMILQVNEESGDYLPKIDFKNYLISLIKGERVISSKEIFTGILKIISDEVINNVGLIGKLLILSIICAVLSNLQGAFQKNTVGELSYYVCYLVIIAIAIKSFAIGMDIGREVINNMVVFMQALLPTLITLLLAVGGITSSGLFQPVILAALSAIATLTKDIIMPLIFISAIIGIISKISNKIQISRLSGLIRQITVAIIGISLTIFIGIMSVQGATTAKVDGVTIRTAKFAVDKFIPIVGSFLSDAMDTVIGCSMLLKNAIGVIGVIALFIICTVPLIKIISLIFVYKIIGAVIEPISDQRILECIGEITKSLVLVFASVASVALMFFITITIIISAGNVTVMLR